MGISRRRFLQRTAIGGAVVVSGVNLTAGCGNDVVAAPVVNEEIEFLDETAATFGQLRLPLADSRFADLRVVGGALTIRIKEPKTPEQFRPFKLPNPRELLVVHRGQVGEPFEYIAVDSACPHQGCPLGFDGKDIACPCHSSKFRAIPEGSTSCVGEVMHAPAKQGPTPYLTELDPNDPSALIIDMRIVGDCGTVQLPPIVGGRIAVPIADYPMLMPSGAGIVGRAAGSSVAVAIARVADTNDAGAFTAVSAVCTHLGCLISYGDSGAATACGTIPAGGGFWCKCHCSQFALDGAVRMGPASKPLPRYGVAFDGTTLTITLT